MEHLKATLNDIQHTTQIASHSILMYVSNT